MLANMSTSIATPRPQTRSTNVKPNAPSTSETPALLVGLASRTFVIVWDDRPLPLRSTEQLCRSVEDFQAGEPVYYRGRLETVRSVVRYR